MKILENLRLELDGSRRGHVLLENKIAKAESRNTEINTKDTTHMQSKDASVAGRTSLSLVSLLPLNMVQVTRCHPQRIALTSAY